MADTNGTVYQKVSLRGSVDSRLFEIVVKDAYKREIPVSQVVAEAVAKAYDRPDLGIVPRFRRGKMPSGTHPQDKDSAAPRFDFDSFKKTKKGDEPQRVTLRGYVDERLCNIVIEDADARHIPVSDAVAQAVAKAYGRPDLGIVPRLPMWRTREKKKPAKQNPDGTWNKVILSGFIDERLYDLVVEEADEHELPLNELMARILARHYDRPELGVVPRHIGRYRGMKMGKKKKVSA